MKKQPVSVHRLNIYRATTHKPDTRFSLKKYEAIENINTESLSLSDKDGLSLAGEGRAVEVMNPLENISHYSSVIGQGCNDVDASHPVIVIEAGYESIRREIHWEMYRNLSLLHSRICADESPAKSNSYRYFLKAL